MSTRWLARSCSLVALLLLLAADAARAEPDAPTIRARFVLHQPGRANEQLILFRSPERVEYQFVERNVHEVWRRDVRGNLEHVKAYPSERKSVRYRDGDLWAIALRPSWAELASLIDPTTLTAHGPSKLRFAGRRAQLLEGRLHGAAARVAWLAELALPVELSMATKSGRVVFELTEVTECHAPCASVDEHSLESIEFSDLGDKTNDPFVRGFLAREEPGHHVH